MDQTLQMKLLVLKFWFIFNWNHNGKLFAIWTLIKTFIFQHKYKTFFDIEINKYINHKEWYIHTLTRKAVKC